MSLYSVKESDGEYLVSIKPRVSVHGEWESFRDVVVVGKAEDGRVVCRRELGDITEVGEGERVTLRCGGFPYTLTFEIAGDPCARDTTVKKLVYDPSQELWISEGIEC